LSEISEEQQGELIRKAIEHADAEAGNDDVAFVRRFRSKYIEQSGLGEVQRRGLDQRRKLANDTYISIYNDPRYARNAREMTRLTRTDLRIIGGTTVQDTNFHDCVAVLSDCGGCTGTLITKNAVLTAGHCHCQMEDASRVFVGNDVGDDSGGEVVNVARQVPHPEYNSGKHNDLMVLVLESEITNVPPRKIASSEMIGRAVYARVVGFGNTDPDGTFGYGKKRQVNVPIVSNSCQGNMNGMNDQEAFNCDPGLELIAGKPMLAMDTCTGDSGGPLYISDGQGGWFLAGATSRSTPGNPHNCGDGGVYVRIDRYLEWVQSIAEVRL
jgi:secreted trypsin-like serine protease